MSVKKDATNSDVKCKFSHFTLEKRKQLINMIKDGAKQSEIASALHMNVTTISRELQRNRYLVPASPYKRNTCMHVQACKLTNICHNMKCLTLCKNCKYDKQCNNICSNYKKKSCKKLSRYPYVCDGCSNLAHCSLDHYRYDAHQADEAAQLKLVESRRGIDLDEESFSKIDRAVVEGTRLGQSIEHICAHEDFSVSSRTIRNYMDKGLTTTKKIETPRGCTFKPRERKISKSQQLKIRTSKIGRTYSDFIAYTESMDFFFFAQMDTVEGSKTSGDVAKLLTFIFPKIRLFLCFPMKNGTLANVQKILDSLYINLGHDDYKFLFGTILTDNGVEFCNPDYIEIDQFSTVHRTRLFYCNPYSSWEKGAIENCHSLLRRIIPKGTSLNGITVNDTKLINSHINSYIRDSNGSKSAYQTFTNAFSDRGSHILKKLGVYYVSPEKVNLTPGLIFKK